MKLPIIRIKLMGPLDAFDKLKDSVNDISTTNWNSFVGSVLAVLGVAGYLFTLIFLALSTRVIDVYAWGLLFGFVAGMAGFSVRQFKHKRETQIENGTKSIRHAKEEAKAAKYISKQDD